MRIAKMLIAAILCGAVASTAATAQTRYPLHCRAGGDMNVNILGQETGGGTEIIIGFRRATVTRGLPAGTCAWHDRVMNSREPASFRLIYRARVSTDFRPRAGDHGGDRADAFALTGTDVEAVRTLFRVLEAGGSFEVQAFNSGRAPMNAISFREVPAR